MCSNYRSSSIEVFRNGVLADIRETKILFAAETFPNELAPIIRLARAESGQPTHFEAVPARFGLVPFWAEDNEVAKLGRMAYNSRTETVASKPIFRTAWNQRRFCLIPAEAFYEPNWESGKAVRWRIEMASHKPFAIAGIWDSHGKDETYFELCSMLTINADTHPVMNHFHRPGDEKRMVVIVEPNDYVNWLNATTPEATSFFKAFPPDLMVSNPAPLAPKASRVKPKAKSAENASGAHDDLFN